MTKIVRSIRFRTAEELCEALGELINSVPAVRYIYGHGFRYHGLVQLAQRRPYDGQLIYDIHILEDPDDKEDCVPEPKPKSKRPRRDRRR